MLRYTEDLSTTHISALYKFLFIIIIIIIILKRWSHNFDSHPTKTDFVKVVMFWWRGQQIKFEQLPSAFSSEDL